MKVPLRMEASTGLMSEQMVDELPFFFFFLNARLPKFRAKKSTLIRRFTK